MKILLDIRKFARSINKRLEDSIKADGHTARLENWVQGADEWGSLERELAHTLGPNGFSVTVQIASFSD